MKTMQAVLRELDTEELEETYLYDHSPKLRELSKNDDRSVCQLRQDFSRKFSDYLQRLRTLEIEPSEDSRTGILYVHKIMGEDSWFPQETIDLIYMDELLAAEDFIKISHYAFGFIRQEVALGFLVAETKLTQDHLYDVASYFLYEMSFFGYKQEELEEEMRGLEESVREFKEHPERMIRYNYSEWEKEFGLPEEEEYPKEQELLDAIHSGCQEYNDYCDGIELEKIKESYLRKQITRWQ